MMTKEIEKASKAPTMEPAKKDFNLYLGGLWTLTGCLNLGASYANPAAAGDINLYLVAAVINFSILPLAIGSRRIRVHYFKRHLEAWEREQKQIEASARS